MTASIRLHKLGLLYQRKREKSRFFYQGKDICHFFADGSVIFPAVGPEAAGAVLDAVFRVAEIAAAGFTQAVQRAVAEQAAEMLRVRPLVAGEIFTCRVLEKVVVCHFSSSCFFSMGGVSAIMGLHRCPGETFRGLVGKAHGLSRSRMGKADTVRPQGDLAGVILLGIFALPYQGHSPAGKLDPDLMGPAGAQQHPYPGHGFAAVQHLVIQDCLLDALCGLPGHHGHFPGLVPVQKICEGSPGLLRAAVEDGQVFLMKCVLPHLAGQLRGGFCVPGKDHDTADHPVQAVDGSDIRMGISQGFPQQIRQSSRLVGGQDPGGLDADDDILVFVENFHNLYISSRAGCPQPAVHRHIRRLEGKPPYIRSS